MPDRGMDTGNCCTRCDCKLCTVHGHCKASLTNMSVLDMYTNQALALLHLCSASQRVTATGNGSTSGSQQRALTQKTKQANTIHGLQTG